MPILTPNDITRREAERVLDLLGDSDRQTMDAHIGLQWRAGYVRAEWHGTIIGAMIFGAIVGVCCWFGMLAYANVSLRVGATDARAAEIERRCLERFAHPSEKGVPR